MNDGTGLQYFPSTSSGPRLTDHLGSVVAVTNASGTLISQQRYLPFGGERTNLGSTSQTDYGYTGQRDLDPGMGRLMDYKARFYSPMLNRFIQPDSIVPSPVNPQTYNRFSYVINSPINLNDPTGHAYCDYIDNNNREDCEGGLVNSQSSSAIWNKKKVFNQRNKDDEYVPATSVGSGVSYGAGYSGPLPDNITNQLVAQGASIDLLENVNIHVETNSNYCNGGGSAVTMGNDIYICEIIGSKYGSVIFDPTKPTKYLIHELIHVRQFNDNFISTFVSSQVNELKESLDAIIDPQNDTFNRYTEPGNIENVAALCQDAYSANPNISLGSGVCTLK